MLVKACGNLRGLSISYHSRPSIPKLANVVSDTGEFKRQEIFYRDRWFLASQSPMHHLQVM
jgi:hypothetical protein